MEPLNSRTIGPSKLFVLAGLILLAVGMLFGLIGALQYILPGFLKQFLSFEKIRPLHVSSVVFWIIFAATGTVITYLQEYTAKKIYSVLLLKIQLVLFILSVIAILVSYCLGIFGGREYWEFPPILALPILVAWLLFFYNFIRSIGPLKGQPVYVWMWLTGIVFFLFTFLESYLWIFPAFRNNIITDMTIQWKSYGSMVGSWNMLIYGSSIYLMEKISGNKTYSRSGVSFALYFTGLFNLMFNWGHHIYTLPTIRYVKHISYAVSMTELFILGNMIFRWRNTVSTALKHFHHTAYRFLIAADVWIFLNLLLAIAMSIPGINVYTHGTHITVAHTMGTTIGINSFLLLAIGYDILSDTCQSFAPNKKWLTIGYWIANLSLFIFWVSLIVAGVLKAKWQMSNTQSPFSSMMLLLKPYFVVFFFSGLTMMSGLLLIIYPIIKNQVTCYMKQTIRKERAIGEYINNVIASD
jgi:nitric oxide reductase subunit B